MHWAHLQAGPPVPPSTDLKAPPMRLPTPDSPLGPIPSAKFTEGEEEVVSSWGPAALPMGGSTIPVAESLMLPQQILYSGKNAALG